jgi:hypothetical protein
MRVRYTIVCFSLLLAACLSPQPPDGAITCSLTDKACPDNYFCGTDQKCHSGAGGGTAGMNCSDYCDCMGMNCAGFFSDEQTCLDACNSLDPNALSCRIYHCGAAATNPMLHCPHAEGKDPLVCK